MSKYSEVTKIKINDKEYNIHNYLLKKIPILEDVINKNIDDTINIKYDIEVEYVEKFWDILYCGGMCEISGCITWLKIYELSEYLCVDIDLTPDIGENYSDLVHYCMHTHKDMKDVAIRFIKKYEPYSIPLEMLFGSVYNKTFSDEELQFINGFENVYIDLGELLDLIEYNQKNENLVGLCEIVVDYFYEESFKKLLSPQNIKKLIIKNNLIGKIFTGRMAVVQRVLNMFGVDLTKFFVINDGLKYIMINGVDNREELIDMIKKCVLEKIETEIEVISDL